MKTEKQWKKIGFKPHHGIVAPLFSLRSKKSLGIGDFFDLIPLIHWCKSIGFDTIQLLPLNDSGNDPSPYNAASSAAIDPIYLSLHDLPQATDLPYELSSLGSLPRLPRSEVKHQKLAWLYHYFQKTFTELSQTASYRQFTSSNPWLAEYTLFKALKDEFSGKDWRQWPPEFQSYPIADSNRFQSGIDFHTFLQYLCFSQLEKIKNYATQKEIFLKGDISILVSQDSADVWARRSLFCLDLVAGAPPDYYNPLGQKWGFPLFNWDAMRQEQFAWWKQRLEIASRFFHIYRIDHVVGYFRIWAIPDDKKPSEGHFIPEDPHYWPSQGREILEMMIDSTPMLPMAEDLGTIPSEVYPILKELGICGTKMMRWQKNWEGDKSYLPLSTYEPLSLTTVSTPDSETLSLWWKNYPDEAIPFAQSKGWSYQPDLSADKRFELLYDAHHTASYFHINLLQEYLALFPELIWPNPEDERINVPGTLLPTNWTYRFRPTLEEILAHQPLAEAMRSLKKH